MNRVVGDYKSKPLHVAFGDGKFASARKGEHFSDPSSSTLGKLIRKKVGSKNFTVCDEWNTSKVCHRCKEPLSVVGCEKTVIGKGDVAEKKKARPIERRSTHFTSLASHLGGHFWDDVF